jgi:hypothetical protein
MAETVQQIEYFYAMVGNKPGEARRLLEHLSEHGINLNAFTAFPVGEAESQLDFFPENAEQLKKAAADAGINLVGPKKAFLIQGRDRVGALHEHHLKLSNAGINIHAANGVIDGGGRFGYVVWVKPEDYEAAAKVLEAQG